MILICLNVMTIVRANMQIYNLRMVTDVIYNVHIMKLIQLNIVQSNVLNYKILKFNQKENNALIAVQMLVLKNINIYKMIHFVLRNAVHNNILMNNYYNALYHVEKNIIIVIQQKIKDAHNQNVKMHFNTINMEVIFHYFINMEQKINNVINNALEYMHYQIKDIFVMKHADFIRIQQSHIVNVHKIIQHVHLPLNMV